jgi:hypothetical protein
MIADQCTGSRIHKGAAAGGQDAGWAREEALDDTPLALPEFVLAMALKKFGDAAGGSLLDFMVGVPKRHS